MESQYKVVENKYLIKLINETKNSESIYMIRKEIAIITLIN